MKPRERILATINGQIPVAPAGDDDPASRKSFWAAVGFRGR